MVAEKNESLSRSDGYTAGWDGRIYTVGQEVRFFSEEGETGLNHTGTMLDGYIVTTIGMKGEKIYGVACTSEGFYTGRLFVREPLDIYSAKEAPQAPPGLLDCCLISDGSSRHCGRVATWATQSKSDIYDRSYACEEHVEAMACFDEEKERLPKPGVDWDQ